VIIVIFVGGILLLVIFDPPVSVKAAPFIVGGLMALALFSAHFTSNLLENILRRHNNKKWII